MPAWTGNNLTSFLSHQLDTSRSGRRMPQEKVGLGERSVHGRVRKILWASEVSYATPHPSTSYHRRHVVSCKVLEQWSSPKHTIKFTCLLFSEISLLTTVIPDIYVQLAHVSLFSLIFETHLIHSYEAMEYNLGWNFLQVRFKISSWPWRIWKLGFILIALQSFNQQKGKLRNRLSFLNPKLMENIRDIFFPYNIIFEQKIIIRLYLYSQQSSLTPSSTLKKITLHASPRTVIYTESDVNWKGTLTVPISVFVFLSPLFHRSHLILSRALFPSMTFPGSPNSVSFTVPGSTARHIKLNHSAFHTAKEIYTLFNCGVHRAHINNFRNLRTFI